MICAVKSRETTTIPPLSMKCIEVDIPLKKRLHKTAFVEPIRELQLTVSGPWGD